MSVIYVIYVNVELYRSNVIGLEVVVRMLSKLSIIFLEVGFKFIEFKFYFLLMV